MKKSGTMFIKNLHYLCLIGVIALGLITIVGTGGGGGGGGDTATTTPTTTMATTTTSATTTLPSDGSLKIINNTSKTITEVYVSPTTSDTWGYDQLTTTISSGGGMWTLTDITPDDYDLKVVFSDGSSYEKWDFSIVAGQTYTLTLTDTNIVGSLKIQNDSSFSITQVYLRPTTQTTWGNDQLPTTIYPGAAWTLTDIPPGDYYLKVVASDGTTYTHTEVLTIVGGLTLNFELFDV